MDRARSKVKAIIQEAMKGTNIEAYIKEYVAENLAEFDDRRNSSLAMSGLPEEQQRLAKMLLFDRQYNSIPPGIKEYLINFHRQMSWNAIEVLIGMLKKDGSNITSRVKNLLSGISDVITSFCTQDSGNTAVNSTFSNRQALFFLKFQVP